MAPSVSVCVCTYRRPQQLTVLIGCLARQRPPAIAELVIVDNDAAGSARAVAESAQTPFPVRYSIQPHKNISLTRNQAVAQAQGEWIGMLDDDELPPLDWLERLWRTAQESRADAVLAPVISEPPPDAPAWILRGDFYARRRFATGTEVPRNEYRIGNAFLRASRLKQLSGPFDADYGLTGGEDIEMLHRLNDGGARIVWCDEAVVTEPVEAPRLKLKWLLMRAFRGGQDFARQTLRGAYGPVTLAARLRFVAVAAGQCLAAALLALALLPAGRHRAVHWLRKTYANAGKLLALLNVRYEEYRK